MTDGTDDSYLSEGGRNERILDLAKELFPEDGYESQAENDAASLFVLLCEVTKLYDRTTDAGHETGDMWSTLQGLAENMSTEQTMFGVTMQTVQPD